MRIYLAARYSRRLQLCQYREEPRAMGHTVQACWLDGTHQIDRAGVPIGDDGEALVEDGTDEQRCAELRRKFAHEDFRDVTMCDLLIAFTEEPRSGHSRGGRHVEMGIALGAMKRVWVVGHRENIFCWHEDVRFFPAWETCKNNLAQETGGALCQATDTTA